MCVHEFYSLIISGRLPCINATPENGIINKIDGLDSTTFFAKKYYP